MEFNKVLEEGFTHGAYSPASNLPSLVAKAKKNGGKKWAENEIRSYVKRITSGNGRTAHDKLNYISAMFSAFKIYNDNDVDKKTKNEVEKEYNKIIEKIRASMYKTKRY